MLTLVHATQSRSFRMLWLLEELGADYDIRLVNIRRADGTVPPVDVIHLHHGVWLNMSRRDLTSPGLPERFMAAGEEKTISTSPPGYGYRFEKGDRSWTE